MTKTQSIEELFQKRYPNLAFMIRVMDGESLDLISNEVSSFNIENVQTLYIYGLGDGRCFQRVEKWLKEDEGRDVVFLEESIEMLKAFLSSSHAFAVLSHKRAHIRFNLDKKRLDDFLKECAATFPVEKIQVIALTAYKEKFRHRFYQIKLKLMRLTTVEHAFFVESVHSHILFKNFLPNYYRLPESFSGNDLKGRFKNIPAIICGAGPSLGEVIPCLRTLENRALIMAGGSAITALSSFDLLPHLSVAVDPNLEEYHRFRDSKAFELPLFYSGRLHPRVFETCNGPFGYLKTDSGGAAGAWMEKRLNYNPPALQAGFDREAMSVTTVAISLAATMGCNPIILAGVDLAFTGNQNYTQGVVSQTATFLEDKEKEVIVSERLLKRKDRLGQPIYTLVKWVMESSSISKFVKANPDIKVINATSGGIGFKGIPYQPLEEISLNKSYDIRGMLHHEIVQNGIDISKEDINSALEELKQSLEKALMNTDLILKEFENQTKGSDPETGTYAFFQMEIEELEAYPPFLREPSFSFQQVLEKRGYLNSSYEDKRAALQSKWLSLRDIIEFYLKELDQCGKK